MFENTLAVDGKTGAIKVARTLGFEPGAILAIDRGYYEVTGEATVEEKRETLVFLSNLPAFGSTTPSI